MIVSVISTSALYMNNRYMERQTFDLFYNQLKLDVSHIQSRALAEKKYIKLIFDTGGTRYIGRRSVYDALFIRNLPKGYSVSQTSTLKEFGFQANGSIETFGTLNILTPDGTKTIRVYIGKGRMKLEE